MSLGRPSLRELFVVATLAAWPGVACAPPGHGSSKATRAEAGASVPIDPDVMAYLSMARARHHEANLEEDTDVKGAIAALELLTEARRPHPGDRVPEIEEVLADTYARMAELRVRQGDLERGEESIRDGLTHALGPSYFRGHLLEVGGILEEARAAGLRDAGRAGEAEAAKARALELLRQAVLVQERVVNASLAEPRTDGTSRGRTSREGGS